MCIKIIGESEFNQVVFLSVDTNNFGNHLI